MPLKSVRFAFRAINPNFKQRLAFDKKTGKVVEVTPYFKKGNVWVQGHSRSPPRRRKA